MDKKDPSAAPDKTGGTTQGTSNADTQTSTSAATNKATNAPSTADQATTHSNTVNQAATNTANAVQATANTSTSNQASTNTATANQITTNPATANQATTNSATNNQETQKLSSNQIPNEPSPKKMSIHFDEKASPSAPTESDDDPPMDADILDDVVFYIGEMGMYQKLLFIGMLPFTSFFVFVYLGQMFITIAPSKFWCKITELDSLTMEMRRNLTAPGAATGGEWDSCNTYDTDWNKVLEDLKVPPADTAKIPCPNGWEYEFTDIPYETVTTERDWVCDRATYVPAAQSIFFVGAVVGGLIFGWIADNLGRIPAIVGSNLAGGIGGIATTFTSGVWDFFFCRFLVGMAFDNCFMVAYILLLEYVGPGHRTFAANMPIAIFGGAAGLLLPWIAYFAADWRLFSWLIYLPMLGVICAPWLMPESVRWLISRKKVDEAVKVLRKFEKVNKTKVPDEVMNTFIESAKKVGCNKKESLLVIFRSTLLRITMVYMVMVYSSGAVVYDTLVRITQDFGIDYFIAFTLNWGIEIPSILLVAFILDKVGRRILTGGTLLFGSFLVFIAMLVPKGLGRVCLGMMARFSINTAYTVLMQWPTEILPTPFRASGSAALHITGFGSSLLSPFIVHSEVLWSPLPFLIVSIWAMVSAILCVLLPETKGQEMPQTIADSEKIIQNQSLCRQPEMDELKQAVSRVLSHTISDTIHRNPEGRVSHLRLQ